MGVFKHPWRVSGRLLWLGMELWLAALRYVSEIVVRGHLRSPAAKGLWLQKSCRRVLRVLNVEIQSRGTLPTSGLLVSNHLSYLDILVLGALTPAVFVAKRDVKLWPVFGWFAMLAGTIFADRARRTRVGATLARMQKVMSSGVLAVLFPEGTSSDGQTVLPFKSALLEPVVTGAFPLSASRIAYSVENGDAAQDVCYWRDMTFLPHLINLLAKSRIQALVAFARHTPACNDRKELASQLHSILVGMGWEPGMLKNTPEIRGSGLSVRQALNA